MTVNNKKEYEKDNNNNKEEDDDDISNLLFGVDYCKSVLPSFPALKDEWMEPVRMFLQTTFLKKENKKEGLKQIITTLTERKDGKLMVRLFIAFSTTPGILQSLVGQNENAELLHRLLRFNPWLLPKHYQSLHQQQQQQEQQHSNSIANKTPIYQLFLDYKSVIFDPPFHMAVAWHRLIISIVSVNSLFLLPVLTQLCQSLQYSANIHASSSSSVLHTPHPNIIQSFTHATLNRIRTVLPPGTVQQIITQSCDNILFGPQITTHLALPTMSSIQLLHSFLQAFHFLHYMPQCRPSIFRYTMQQAIRLDVQLPMINEQQKQEQQQDGNHDETTKQAVPVNQIADKVSYFYLFIQLNNSTPGRNREHGVIPTFLKMAQRLSLLLLLPLYRAGAPSRLSNSQLDVLMTLLLEYMHHEITQPTNNDGGISHQFYHIWIPIFDQFILTTYRSKFVQFIFFYLCQHNHLDQAFIKHLIQLAAIHENHPDYTSEITTTTIAPLEIGFNNNNNNNDANNNVPKSLSAIRQSALCYLASFVSRATYIHIDLVANVLEILLNWAQNYQHHVGRRRDRDGVEYDNASTDATAATKNIAQYSQSCQRHVIFYTVCQAAFYISCFRGVELMQSSSENNNDDEERKQRLERIRKQWTHLACHHVLEPLQYCLPSVRHEFEHLAQLHKWLLPNYIPVILQPTPTTTSTSNGIVKSSSNMKPIMKQHQQQKHRLFQRRTKSQLNRQRRRRHRGTPLSNTRIQIGATKSSSSSNNSSVVAKKIFTSSGSVSSSLSSLKSTMSKATISTNKNKNRVYKQNPLDSFFPFDPYLLPKSLKFIEPIYRHWTESTYDDDLTNGSSLSSSSSSSSLYLLPHSSTRAPPLSIDVVVKQQDMPPPPPMKITIMSSPQKNNNNNNENVDNDNDDTGNADMDLESQNNNNNNKNDDDDDGMDVSLETTGSSTTFQKEEEEEPQQGQQEQSNEDNKKTMSTTTSTASMSLTNKNNNNAGASLSAVPNVVVLKTETTIAPVAATPTKEDLPDSQQQDIEGSDDDDEEEDDDISVGSW